MPSKNTIKEFEPNSYYHAYNRGVDKRVIFLDEQDYATFLNLLKQYLGGGKNKLNTNRHAFDKLNDGVDLLAYCLMPNHFHLLFYLKDDETSLTKLMRRVATGYVMYFNDKYKRTGGLFEGRYKASKIDSSAYLDHISRYIHLNPKGYKTYPYSSYKYYVDKQAPNWINANSVLSLFGDDKQKYERFVEDYEDATKELSYLKYQLANTDEK